MGVGGSRGLCQGSFCYQTLHSLQPPHLVVRVDQVLQGRRELELAAVHRPLGRWVRLSNVQQIRKF